MRSMSGGGLLSFERIAVTPTRRWRAGLPLSGAGKPHHTRIGIST